MSHPVYHVCSSPSRASGAAAGAAERGRLGLHHAGCHGAHRHGTIHDFDIILALFSALTSTNAVITVVPKSVICLVGHGWLNCTARRPQPRLSGRMSSLPSPPQAADASFFVVRRHQKKSREETQASCMRGRRACAWGHTDLRGADVIATSSHAPPCKVCLCWCMVENFNCLKIAGYECR